MLHFRELAPELPKPAELGYVMFGSGDSLALAHLLSAPEDFDQILTVEVDGADVDLTAGWSLSFPTRSNKVGDRLKVGEEISCAADDGRRSACVWSPSRTARSVNSPTSSAGSPATASATQPPVPVHRPFPLG